MINPIFTPYCENCNRADLSLEELEIYDLHMSGGSTWHVKCSHEDACRRIAKIIAREGVKEEK